MVTVKFPGNNLLSVHDGRWAMAAPDADAETVELLNTMDYAVMQVGSITSPHRDRQLAEWARDNFMAEIIHDDGHLTARAI